MTFKKIILIPFWGLIILIMLGGGLLALAASMMNTPQVKTAAEEILSNFLVADVSIQEIRPSNWNEIRLESFKVSDRNVQEAKPQISIPAIELSYHPQNIFKRHFQNPSVVSLRKPQIQFEEFPPLFELLGRLCGHFSTLGVKTIRFSQAQVNIPWKVLDGGIQISGISGKIVQKNRNLFHVYLRGNLTGEVFQSGEIRIDGSFDLTLNQYQLEIKFKKIESGEKIGMPFKLLEGKIVATESYVRIQNITSELYGWKTYTRGKIEHPLNVALGYLEWGMKNQPRSELRFDWNLSNHKFEGYLRASDEEVIPIKGVLASWWPKVDFSQVIFNDLWAGTASLDFQKAILQLALKQQESTVKIETKLSSQNIQTEFQLDHLKSFHHDWVSKGKVSLKPSYLWGHEKAWKFRADLDTDYLIVSTIPLSDFRSSFEVTPRGIENLKSDWGRHFKAEGGFFPKNGSIEMDLNIMVKGLKLEEMNQFANKPLPHRLGGEMRGNMVLQGPSLEPQVTGNFMIKEGMWDGIPYDQALVEFYGLYPRATLKESKIQKGRTTLDLIGVIDFSSLNMFNGIEIQTPDKILVWKGLNFNSNKREGNLELSFDQSKWGFLGIDAGASSGESSLPANAADEETYVTLGPKIKF